MSEVDNYLNEDLSNLRTKERASENDVSKARHETSKASQRGEVIPLDDIRGQWKLYSI